MADNLKDRLARAVRSKDPNNTDGPHFVDTSGTMTLTNGGGGVSQVDDTGFVPGVNSLSPIGGYQGGRSVASGHIAAPAINASGMLIVAVGAGGAGGGVAQLQVQGTEGNWFNVGYASGGDFRNIVPISGSINPHGVFAPAGSIHVLGSVNIVPPPNMTVWLANGGAGGGFATVGVYGSVSVVGSVNIVPPPNMTVWLANQNAGAGFASVAVYGSPAMPVYVIGSVNMVGGGGSLGVTQIGAPWSMVGSMGVTPLASFTVNQGSIATVNLGLGTVNIGNVVSFVGSVNITPQGVQVVDVRGSLTATTWAISGSGGAFQFAACAASPNKIYLYGIKAISSATVDMQIQSPSGTTLDGSMRILPGAGFVDNAPLGTPVYIAALGSGNFVINLSGAAQISGIARGWVGP